MNGACGLPLTPLAGQERAAPAALFGKENLVAWCIVPFDAKKRGLVFPARPSEEGTNRC